MRHSLAVPLVLLLATLPAYAAGISHFQPAGGPHNYTVTADPAVLGHLSPSLWSSLTYAHDPLVLRNQAGVEVSKVVEHHLALEVGGAIGLFDLLELGVAAPGAYLAGDGLGGGGLSVITAGDPRVMAKLKLTPWDDGFLAAVRADVDLPLARWNAKALGLLGDPYPVLRAGGVIGYRGRWLRTALDVGYVLRAPSRVGRQVVGHELRYGVAAEVPLWPDVLFATGDVYGRVAPSFLFSSSTQLPVEGALGVKAVLGPVQLSAGVGGGLWAGYGTPDARVFAAVAFVPEGAEAAPAPLSSPTPTALEPVEPDAAADSDGDGVRDVEDACPDAAEDDDDWLDADGCADLDNDGDGIADVMDECPHDREAHNGHRDEDGCPDSLDADELSVVVKRDTIEFDETVFFKRESSRILPRAYPVLRRIAEVINEHTEIRAVLIEGHTDSTGPDGYNRRLSRWRALSVRQFLIREGVSPARLRVRSFADTKPAVSNRTAAGRAKNRRVELHILRADQMRNRLPTANGDSSTRMAERGADAAEGTP